MRSALIVALALAAPAAAQDEAVITVTGPAGVRSVTQTQLDHWTEIARAAGVGRGPRQQAFRLLLGNTWIEAEAAERGLTVSDERVAREFRSQRRQSFPTRRDFRRFLRESGQTVADILYRVRVDLLSQMIREAVVAPVEASITDAMIDARVAELGDRRIPERRDVRLLLTKRRSEAVLAKRALRAGATWKSVARRYARGGRPRTLERGLERRGLERGLAGAVFRARPRRIVGPVRTALGYYVFRVVRIHPPRELPEARLRELARDVLVAEGQERALEEFTISFRAKWRSRTVCAPRYARFCR
jgi:foldase protein PrsA